MAIRRLSPRDYFQVETLQNEVDHQPFYALLALLGFFALVIGLVVIYKDKGK